MLVKVENAKIFQERTAGQSFGVAGPYPANPDTILIDNNITRTFDPNQGYYVTVTGVLEVASTLFAGSPWRIQPRNDADIVVNPTLGVDPQLPPGITFAIAPNPARFARVTFTLPKRDHVNISVYDLAGRRLAVLADGEFAAERHFVDWNGLDMEGNPVRSGVYFYKMKIGGETFQRRGVLIN